MSNILKLFQELWQHQLGEMIVSANRKNQHKIPLLPLKIVLWQTKAMFLFIILMVILYFTELVTGF